MSQNPDTPSLSELMAAIRDRIVRSQRILSKLEDRATGGHPDHGDPDPIFRQAADMLLLSQFELSRAAETLSRLSGNGGGVGAAPTALEEVEKHLQFLDDYLGGIDGYDLTNWHAGDDDKVSGLDEGTLDCSDAFKAIEAIRLLLQAERSEGGSPTPIDDGAVESLRELIVHCWVHSGYRDCGFEQMTTEQKQLYRSLTCRAALQACQTKT